ncbi:GNAT family N-acetyltransferase [Gymnodinialimonas sp.]
MSAFVGTEQAIALQQDLAARAAEIAANPVLSNGGRLLNILDPDAYGWDAVREEAQRAGYVGLSMVDKDTTLARAAQIFGGTVDLPCWEVFTGTPAAVLPVCKGLVSAFALPEGWRASAHTHPDEALIEAAQQLNVATGVAPQPAYYLAGAVVPSTLACLHDDAGALVACASASMRYHPDGPLGGWLFAGNVSVHPDHRRKGLGVYVNAVLLAEAHRAHGWCGVLEQAKADNAASVGMIRACGLVQDPSRVTVLVNTTGEFVTR